LQKSQKKVSVMANADEILNYANQWGVEMVLHGHEHQPTVTAVRRWPVDGAMSSLLWSQSVPVALKRFAIFSAHFHGITITSFTVNPIVSSSALGFRAMVV